MGEDGCGRAKSEVRDPGGEWTGADDGAVPGVWDFASDGLSLAAKIPAGGQHRTGGRAEPETGAQSVADRAGEGNARGGVAAPVRLGCEEDRSAARGRSD